jgi:hypothetical protein
MADIPQSPYPLIWPENVPRSKARVKSSFRTELKAAVSNVRKSLELFAADSGKRIGDLVVTSDVAGILGDIPKDPGVALWFEWDGAVRCIAVDRYESVKDNLQAIHHVIEARRTELRHAGIEMTRTTFRGFTAALPPPKGESWWDVLGLERETDDDAVINAFYKAAARLYAADQARMQRINVARDTGLKLARERREVCGASCRH